MFKKFIFLVFIVFVGVFFFDGGVYAKSTGPLQQIQASVSEIIHIVQNDQLQGKDSRETRRKLICKAVERRFNFRLMTKLSLGKSWGKMTVRDQNRFVYLFTSLLENTYVRRLEGYSGEKIVYNKDVVKGNRAVVYSILGNNNSGLSLIYKLRNEGGQQWLVYDVLLEGASIIKQYRRQFAQVVEHENIDALMAQLEKKVKVVFCEI